MILLFHQAKRSKGKDIQNIELAEKKELIALFSQKISTSATAILESIEFMINLR